MKVESVVAQWKNNYSNSMIKNLAVHRWSLITIAFRRIMRVQPNPISNVNRWRCEVDDVNGLCLPVMRC